MRRRLLPKHVIAVIRSQKDPLRALEIFHSVKKEPGFQHSISSYRSIATKLGSHGEFLQMEKIFEEMRSNFDNSLLEFAYVDAIKIYGIKGKVQNSVEIFSRMEFFNCDPSVHSYNALMNVLVEHSLFESAHTLYLTMRSKGIDPDLYTFTIRMKSLCNTGRPLAAARLLHNMEPCHGCTPNAVSYCTVAAGFYSADSERLAVELFDEMLGLGLFPEVSIFNKLLHAACRKGGVLRGERIFSKVLKRGISPNLFTFNIFIRGICEKGMVDAAVGVMSCMRGEGVGPDLVTYNTVIHGLCRNGGVARAEGYLRRMVNDGLVPDVFTYNSVIDGYCKVGMAREAERVLKYAVFRGFVADDFTYSSLVGGFCRERDMEKALYVFRAAVERGVNPSTVMFNTLIKGLSSQGFVSDALDLMGDMDGIGCRPDVWTYNSVVHGLCKAGQVFDARRLVETAVDKGFVPDIFTFNTLVDGYCKRKRVDEALEVVDGMRRCGVVPDLVTSNSVLDGLCKASRYDDVEEVFEEMERTGRRPNIITYNILMESMCKGRRVGEAVEMLGRMEERGVMPDVISFGTVADGLCRGGDLEGAFRLFRRMEEEYNHPHTTSTYNILLNACSRRLDTSAMKRLFEEMGERGCIRDGYTYRVSIDGFCRKGDADSARDFLLAGMEEGLTPSLITFGHVLNCLCMAERVVEAVSVVMEMADRGIVPDTVDIIPQAGKREVDVPKVVVEDLLNKGAITYYTYEILYLGMRNKKVLRRLRKTNKWAS